MVILFFFFVFLSIVDTFRISLVLMLNVILIWGIFLGAGGILVSSNFLSRLLFLVMVRFFSYIWINIFGWLSEYVVKVCVCLVGMVVFFLMRLVIIFSVVLIFRDRGVIFNRSKFCIFSDLFSERMAVWIVVKYKYIDELNI